MYTFYSSHSLIITWICFDGIIIIIISSSSSSGGGSSGIRMMQIALFLCFVSVVFYRFLFFTQAHFVTGVLAVK
jgi:hypothetical protein